MIYTYAWEGFCCISRIKQFQPNIVNNSKRISSNFGRFIQTSFFRKRCWLLPKSAWYCEDIRKAIISSFWFINLPRLCENAITMSLKQDKMIWASLLFACFLSITIPVHFIIDFNTKSASPFAIAPLRYRQTPLHSMTNFACAHYTIGWISRSENKI